MPLSATKSSEVPQRSRRNRSKELAGERETGEVLVEVVASGGDVAGGLAVMTGVVTIDEDVGAATSVVISPEGAEDVSDTDEEGGSTDKVLETEDENVTEDTAVESNKKLDAEVTGNEDVEKTGDMV
jgi:hypothetical protein